MWKSRNNPLSYPFQTAFREFFFFLFQFVPDTPWSLNSIIQAKDIQICSLRWIILVWKPHQCKRALHQKMMLITEQWSVPLERFPKWQGILAVLIHFPSSLEAARPWRGLLLPPPHDQHFCIFVPFNVDIPGFHATSKLYIYIYIVKEVISMPMRIKQRDSVWNPQRFQRWGI